MTTIDCFYKNWGYYLEGVWRWRISGDCLRKRRKIL